MDTIRITIESNAEQAAKTFEQLADAFNDTDNSAKDLRKEIKGLKDDIYKLTPGTEEYTNKVIELGAKMNTLGDIQRDLKASSGDLGDVFSTTTKAVSSMASGFQAAAGIVTLFGGDNEDLKKTFIQLQSVMAIAQGLSGFAGFKKATETASASMKAFIDKIKLSTNSVRSDTVAKQANNTATMTMATVENTATGATITLKGAVQSLTAAIASNPIGAVLVALTAVIAAVTTFSNRSKEAAAAAAQYAKDMADMEAGSRKFNSVLEQELYYFNQDIAAMKKLGASQESINAKTLEFSKTRKAELEQERDYLKHLYEVNHGTKELAEQCQEWKQKVTELNAEIKQLDTTITDLTYTLPAFRVAMDEAFDNLDRDLSRQLARGEISERQYFQNLRDGRQKDIDDLKKQSEDLAEQLNGTWELTENGYRHIESTLSESQKKEIEKQKRDIDATIENYTSQVETFTKKLEDADDRAYKSRMDKTRQLAKESSAERQRIFENMQKDFDDILKKVDKEGGMMAVLTGAVGGDQAQVSMKKASDELGREIESFLTNIRKQINESSKLLGSDKNALLANADAFFSDLKKRFDEYGLDSSVIPENIAELAVKLQGYTDTFISENNTMMEALKKGQVTLEQYNKWLADNYKKLMEDRATALKGQNDTVIGILAGTNISESDKEAINKKLDDILDDILDGIEDEYENKLNVIDVKYMGKSDNIWTKLFGVPDLARMKAQLKEAEQALDEMYTQEMTELDSRLAYIKSVYGEESAEYKALQALKLQLYKEYLEKKKELQKKEKEDEEDTWLDVTKKVSSTASAVGSFASAMSDYYEEMANNEKEGSKKQKEYTIKSLKAQKYQTIATTAAGMVSAVVSAIQSLGFPAGPIVGGIEAAALAVMAAAQIKSINRQIKEVGGSGGGGDDVQAAGMMDRIITANAQNSDQTAQLNAQYIGDEMEGATKVYVTQNDITDAQNKNQVAVTQNTF